MLTELEFDLPIKTVSEANRRDHWRERAKRRIYQQHDTSLFFKHALRGREIQLPCVVKLTRVGPKKMDTDNLAGSFKAIRDQIARVLGVDDGDSRIRFEYEQKPTGRREYNVKVEIRSNGET